MDNNADAKQTDKKKQTGRLKPLLVLVIIVPLCGLLWTKLVVPFFESGGGSSDTRPVPGDATRFDPVTALPDVTAYAGDGAQLTQINAYFVRADGTMDLSASYHPYVEYEFARKVPAPADAPPVGAGGKANGSWYEPVTIKAYEPGKWWTVTSGKSSYSYMNHGMERKSSKATTSPRAIIEVPACTFKQLWSAASEKGASSDAVATIEYNERGYSFTIRDTDVRLQFDQNCHLIQ